MNARKLVDFRSNALRHAIKKYFAKSKMLLNYFFRTYAAFDNVKMER